MLGEIMEALEALEEGELLLRVVDRVQLERKFKCEKDRKEDSPYICPAVNMPTPYHGLDPQSQPFNSVRLRKHRSRTSLVAQWLRMHSQRRGLRLSPWLGK